jgi:hypothetical protein
LQVGTVVTHGLQEQAFFGLSGNDDFSGVTAGRYRLTRVETESALDRVGLLRVTFVAVFNEQRADFGFKKNVFSAADSWAHTGEYGRMRNTSRYEQSGRRFVIGVFPGGR